LSFPKKKEHLVKKTLREFFGSSSFLPKQGLVVGHFSKTFCKTLNNLNVFNSILMNKKTLPNKLHPTITAAVFFRSLLISQPNSLPFLTLLSLFSSLCSLFSLFKFVSTIIEVVFVLSS
jgi:hypothetical protein